ncbi:hypothetical protein RQM59_08855 [Flavobacteriaceae bacterium S356]|uniref:Tetratricopeptide repeat protein n=1 Tax=Asprobacillus argus TaxID=3076534 RepID=A0ABU3LFW2_9FLAO|nr:hypothetical protein [Flavobacteriaceae bacterium S356]
MVITPQEYISILKNPETLEVDQLQGVKSIVESYPYFQSARAIYLKGLKDQDSYKYNSELKVTAAYTNDRTLLFDFITSKAFDPQNNIHNAIQQKLLSEQPKEVPIEKELELGKPLTFAKTETHSFNQWLQLSVKKPIVRGVSNTKETVVDKESIIDRFIKSNPKISPAKKGEEIDISIPKNSSDSSLMTETLARVYLEQKKYDSAIKAYKILSLKYPEKSGFFADQIKRVKNLQKYRS